jgi:TadE-like protein
LCTPHWGHDIDGRAVLEREAVTTATGASRGRGRQGGAALVETAICIPLLVLLLFGIIDFGAVFNDYLSVRQGTREGARTAAVNTTPLAPNGGPWIEGTNCTTQSLVDSLMNAVTAGDGYDLVCFTKDRLGLDESKTRVSVWFNPQVNPTYAEGQGVVICTQYAASSISGVLNPFIQGHILSSRVEIRIEQPTNSFQKPVSETALTSWPAACRTP